MDFVMNFGAGPNGDDLIDVEFTVRPWVEVTLCGVDSYNLAMLIDTGADTSSIPYTWARLLGLELPDIHAPDFDLDEAKENNVVVRVEGIGGYIWEVSSTLNVILRGEEGYCKILDFEIGVSIGTDSDNRPSYNEGPIYDWPILGREPLLDIFKMLYDQVNGYAILSGPNPKHAKNVIEYNLETPPDEFQTGGG